MLSFYECEIERGAESMSVPLLRYGLIERLAASARARDVEVVAFGLGERRLRLLLEGEAAESANVVRGVKGGTVRAAKAWDAWVRWGENDQRVVAPSELFDAVVACHTVGPHADPLANPWTSHRDLLAFRRASFFDGAALRARVDALEVHRRAGGEPLPGAPTGPHEAGLDRLMRVSAAVLGVPPAHRRCFRLFVHAARRLGFGTTDLASALMLTRRRIRQLAADAEPLVPLALVHLEDERLARVP
jgi:hypothetical protein